MKKIFCLIIILLVSGCLETPKGKLPSINQAEIDIEAEIQKRVSYAKFIDQMSLVKSIGYKVNSSNADICNKTDFKSGITFANENVMGLKIAKFFPTKINFIRPFYSEGSEAIAAIERSTPLILNPDPICNKTRSLSEILNLFLT